MVLILGCKNRTYRNDPLFLRNGFDTSGRLGFPLIKRQVLDISDIHLISCGDARSNDSSLHKKCGVHFYVDDYRFTSIYNNPDKSLKKYSQYKFLLTPDFSTYSEMDPWRQIESIAHSHWCGAYWQAHGLTVVPTITWSTPSSYLYCYEAIEKHCIVSVGMIGCKRENRRQFMMGYNEMLRRIEPEYIICVGKPFPEMQGNIIIPKYEAYGREVS